VKSEKNFNKKPLIYLITKGDLTPENFTEKKLVTLKIIKSTAENNISVVQIREKKIPARLVFELTSEALKITQNSKTKILVNDRADIAFAAKADGVHLTSSSIPTAIVRQNFPKDFIIGVSTHSLETALKAKNEGADFATFSPIFRTVSKAKYGEPQGLEKLKEVCESLKPFPIIALGGIDETNYESVLKNDASGFAAIRFLNEENNLRKLSADL
jgi:thiamine-phosphate pyrophosphorylase